MLMSILARDEVEKVVVFGETKFGVQRLSDTISKSGIPSEAIHGNKSQSQRERALKMFKDKNNNINVLVATDVAARGLDIPDVTHVINYDIPQAYDDYIHRIGRTGRAGKSGTALTFIQSAGNAGYRQVHPDILRGFVLTRELQLLVRQYSEDTYGSAL